MISWGQIGAFLTKLNDKGVVFCHQKVIKRILDHVVAILEMVVVIFEYVLVFLKYVDALSWNTYVKFFFTLL